MGAQSDFLSESFVPGEQHRAEQIARARTLLATGFTPEQIAAMFSLSVPELQEALPRPDSRTSH